MQLNLRINGEPITKATLIRVGDRIQLGYLGPAMVVAELELEEVAGEQTKSGDFEPEKTVAVTRIHTLPP